MQTTSPWALSHGIAIGNWVLFRLGFVDTTMSWLKDVLERAFLRRNNHDGWMDSLMMRLGSFDDEVGFFCREILIWAAHTYGTADLLEILDKAVGFRSIHT